MSILKGTTDEILAIVRETKAQLEEMSRAPIHTEMPSMNIDTVLSYLNSLEIYTETVSERVRSMLQYTGSSMPLATSLEVSKSTVASWRRSEEDSTVERSCDEQLQRELETERYVTKQVKQELEKEIYATTQLRMELDKERLAGTRLQKKLERERYTAEQLGRELETEKFSVEQLQNLSRDLSGRQQEGGEIEPRPSSESAIEVPISAGKTLLGPESSIPAVPFEHDATDCFITWELFSEELGACKILDMSFAIYLFTGLFDLSLRVF
jgi:hypothetical protein